MAKASCTCQPFGLMANALIDEKIINMLPTPEDGAIPTVIPTW